VEVEEERVDERVDERSVDDLLSFINGDGDSKAVRAVKNKKKNRRKKDQLKEPCTGETDKASSKKGAASLSTTCHEAVGKCSPTPSRSSVRHESTEDDFVSKVEFDDADIDDELDPAMKEELDREVEDFARRLNSDWPERMQEILSLGQERRLVPNLMHGNGSLRRYDRG